MSKTFTHESERVLRQSPQPERTEAPVPAAPTVEEQAARAAWQTYVGSLAPASEAATEGPGRRRPRKGAPPAADRTSTGAGPEKEPA